MSEMHPDTLAALHAAIRAEIANDPAGRGYAGKTAAEITTLINAPYSTTPPATHRDVSISDVEGYLRARLIVARLRAWVDEAATGTAKLAAQELLDIIASPRLAHFTTSTDSGRANILGLFATLVAATGGIVTQQHYDDLAAMTLSQAPAVPQPARWALVIDGISAAPTPEPAEGEDPHPGYAGPPNAADEALIQDALDG